MKLNGEITINGVIYRKGDIVPWSRVYPFFLLHMLVFGTSGFYLAYAPHQSSELFLYLHGGFAVMIYIALYVVIFGADEVKWMLINAALGTAGIMSQLAWLLARFGVRIDDRPWHVHLIPFLYYVLYVFLIRHAFLDFFDAREDPIRRAKVEKAYVMVSLVICAIFYLLNHHLTGA